MLIKDFGYKPLKNLEFNENNHSYKLDGIPLIGTTTVINCKAKDFLKFWTVKLMFTVLMEKWDIKKVYTKKEKEELLLLAKKAHTVKLDKASDSGKIAHALIQESIEIKVRFEEHSEFLKNPEVKLIYNNWLDWEKTHKIEYLATELIIGSKALWTGGTLDAVAMVDGELTLLDWKSSTILSDDVSIQTAGYKYMLIECGVDSKIKRRAIRLDKTKVVFEDRLIKTPYEKDLKCFSALVDIYRWNRDIKKTEVTGGN